MAVPVTQEYRDAVTELATKKVNRRFLNDSGEHATLLIELMIGKAGPDDDVLIYSGELMGGCYRKALEESGSNSIRILTDAAKARTVIDALPEGVRKCITHLIIDKADQGNHFFVVGSAFRWELDHSVGSAVANFNEPETPNKLRARFEDMWKRADKLV